MCGAPSSPGMGLQELTWEGAGRHAHGHAHLSRVTVQTVGGGREGQAWTGPGRLLEEDGLELDRKDA